MRHGVFESLWGRLKSLAYWRGFELGRDEAEFDRCDSGTQADAVSIARASVCLALARCFTLSLLSWPQAAMMSRPRGVRTGEA